jgi:hypothetical protein
MENFNAFLRGLASFICISVCLTCALPAQTLLYSEGFETDGEGSRYTSNTYIDCGNSDFFTRTNTNPVQPTGCGAPLFTLSLTNVQGSFFWASEDIRTSTPTPGSRPPGEITTQSFNITSYGSLTVSLYVACSNNGSRWEGADSINIQASINGGPFRTFGRFLGKGAPAVGANLGIDGNLNGVYDAGVDPAANVDAPNFTQYTFNIAGTGTSMRIRIDCDQIGGTEELAMDQIEVRGVVIVPVKWASFTAEQADETVILNWATMEEVGVREYQVERFDHVAGYQSIGRVEANGTAGSYDFVDAHPQPGVNVYRIRQVDEDDAFSYSEAVEVTVVPTFHPVLYPNPMRDGARLAMAAPASGILNLLNPTGRLVRSQPFEEVTELEINRGGLPAGVYYLRLELRNGKGYTHKLVIQ